MIFSFPDFLMALIWLAVNGLLFWSAWQVGRVLFVCEKPLYRLVHTTILSVACVVIASIMLGVFGCLTSYVLLIAVSLISTMAAVIARRSMANARCVTASLASPEESVASESETPVRHPGWDRFWNGMWLVVFAFYAGHVIEGGLLQFPSTWDSLMYHIPLIDHWLAAGSLYIPDCPRWADPGNSELIGLWMVAPFTGDFLIALNNLPAFIVLALGTVMLMDTLEAPPFLSHLGGVFVVSNYVVMRQALDAKNDVAVAAFFIVAVAYCLRYYRTGKFGNVVLCGIAVGVLSGIKYYALGYVALACTLMVVVTMLRNVRSLGRVVMTGVLCLVLLGGYWYARNVSVSGTPFYPKGFTSESDVLTSRRPASLWSSTLLGNPSPEVTPLACRAVWIMTGPGNAVALLLSPIVFMYLLASVLLWGRGRGSSPYLRTCYLVLAVLLLTTGIFLGITPFATETAPGSLNMLRWGYAPIRFGLCFLTLAVVGVLTLLGDSVCRTTGGNKCHPTSLVFAMRLVRFMVLTVLLTAFIYQLMTEQVRRLEGDLFFGGIIGFDIVLASFLLAETWRKSLWCKRLIFPVLLVSTSLVIGFLGSCWHNGYANHFDKWSGTTFFSQMASKPPEEVRVCACYFRYYPLFGSRRQFYACRPERADSQNDLFKFIHHRDVTHVAAIRNSQDRSYGNVKDWLAEFPEVFAPTDYGKMFTVYTVDQLKLEAILHQAAATYDASPEEESPEPVLSQPQ